jgi:hypothetical protein
MILILTGCASNDMDVDNLFPRYVSPLHYLDYSCKQMQLTNLEFQQAISNYELYQSPRPNLVYRYKQTNEIAPLDQKIDQIGKSVLLGHIIALNRAAKNNNCAL